MMRLRRAVIAFFNHDDFHLVWKRMQGDFILRTRAHFIGKGAEPHRKLGWIARSSLEPDSPHVSAAVHGDGLTALQFRRTKNGKTEEIRSTLKGADIIQLERKGDIYIMSAARFGETFIIDRVSGVPLGDEVYVGLFVCSHDKLMCHHGRLTARESHLSAIRT